MNETNRPTADILYRYFADFTGKQQEQWNALYDLYLDWNSKINVISRKDMDQFYLHHVLHSLTIAAQFDFPTGTTVLDLGCGGGFPGVPLALYFPEVKFMLVDSVGKKLTVVNEVCQALGITNVETRHQRVESIQQTKVDVVVSRAVAPLKDLWKWSKPLIRKNKPADDRPNGLICLKGGDLAQEIFESGCKPMVWEISQYFEEAYFEEKFMLYQPI